MNNGYENENEYYENENEYKEDLPLSTDREKSAELCGNAADSAGTEAAADRAAEKSSGGKNFSAVGTVYDYFETFCYALAVMMVLFLFVFRYASVDGESMRKTLEDKDRLIISNFLYTPKTGDIVVLNPECNDAGAEPIIKRVIATGGQKVFIDYQNWKITVDGVTLDEPYIEAMRDEMRSYFGDDVAMSGSSVAKYRREFVVDDGKVFVMGDNRNASRDSRDPLYGEIGVNRILGRVLFRIYPVFGGVD